MRLRMPKLNPNMVQYGSASIVVTIDSFGTLGTGSHQLDVGHVQLVFRMNTLIQRCHSATRQSVVPGCSCRMVTMLDLPLTPWPDDHLRSSDAVDDDDMLARRRTMIRARLLKVVKKKLGLVIQALMWRQQVQLFDALMRQQLDNSLHSLRILWKPWQQPCNSSLMLRTLVAADKESIPLQLTHGWVPWDPNVVWSSEVELHLLLQRGHTIRLTCVPMKSLSERSKSGNCMWSISWQMLRQLWLCLHHWRVRPNRS